jgi:hypothetical protein
VIGIGLGGDQLRVALLRRRSWSSLARAFSGLGIKRKLGKVKSVLMMEEHAKRHADSCLFLTNFA